MVTHSSILAWRIPWTEMPGRLQSTGSQRVRHDWATSLTLLTYVHIKKQRHYFANKGLSSQSYGFPVVMYGCESWTIKKAERWRIDAFELWCWRRLLRVPWTERRSNKPILKEISPEYSLEGLMLKLKLQSFGHLMQRNDSLERTLLLGETENRRRRGRQDEMVGWCHRLDGHEFGQALGVGDGQGSLVCCSPWGHKELDTIERLNWMV